MPINHSLMYQLIDELIAKLDSFKDAFLIGMLEAKKSELDDLKINIDPQDLHNLTLWAKSEARKIIPFSYQKEIDKIEKLNKTLFNCQICPLAKWCNIDNELSYNEDSKICERCGKRQWKLIMYKEHLEKMHEKILDQIVTNEEIVDIVRMKSIIRNINRKLKNL